MPETTPPTLTGYYDSDYNTLWTHCRHCHTHGLHTAGRLRAGHLLDIRGRRDCRPDCPLVPDRVSAYTYQEAHKL
ncbi:hypothetical protein ACIQCG_38775 [Streptomyces noursei]|uniref:hypothetical protein n=1 Tax=Streptomyces noursei TaxID=1971 RepID=UPI003807C007